MKMVLLTNEFQNLNSFTCHKAWTESPLSFLSNQFIVAWHYFEPNKSKSIAKAVLVVRTISG